MLLKMTAVGNFSADAVAAKTAIKPFFSAFIVLSRIFSLGGEAGDTDTTS